MKSIFPVICTLMLTVSACSCPERTVLTQNEDGFLVMSRGRVPAEGAMNVQDDGNNFVIKSGNKTVLSYKYTVTPPPEGVRDVYSRSGYIHPACTPSGFVYTNIQPEDHRHHYGIWNPWTRVEYEGQVYDLWNLGDSLGTVRAGKVREVVKERDEAGFTASLEHVAFTPDGEKTIMNEDWTISATDAGDAFIWDFRSTLTPCTGSPVTIKAYRYQGFSCRATDVWTAENSSMMTSEGLERPDIDCSRADWIYVNGANGDKSAGFMFMSDPGNYDSPEQLRIWDRNSNGGRGDVYVDFCPAKTVDWVLEPGKSYVLQYRVVAYDGEMTPETASRLWEEYEIYTGRKSSKITLLTLDPGHFHAALVQKTRYPQVSRNVYVYSPGGSDLDEHLAKIEAYNTREADPTDWNEDIYAGPDFFEKMISDRKGNVMVTAGNNARKTEYIKKTLEAGINVLADKPMAINSDNFETLCECFDIAREKGVLLYDIMTERFEISTILQKEIAGIPEIFGQQEKGDGDNPGITMESVHCFYKNVSGKALTRPGWFYDVEQQGEGIADVMVHLVDLVQWEVFPEQAIDYRTDIELGKASHWSTPLSLEQFRKSTGLDDFPEFLKGNVKSGVLNVFANGEINYRLKDVYAKVRALWIYEAPAGGGDSHYSMMRGSKANLVIRQGAEQHLIPELYIEPVAGYDADYVKDVEKAFGKLSARYPGIELKKYGNGFHVIIPQSYRNGHEAHFGQVTSNFIDYLENGNMPSWEVPNMIAKYYTTTKAWERAQN